MSAAFRGEEVALLLGRRVFPSRELPPASSCGRVVGAEPFEDGWALLVAAEFRGVEVILLCDRADYRAFLIALPGHAIVG